MNKSKIGSAVQDINTAVMYRVGRQNGQTEQIISNYRSKYVPLLKSNSTWAITAEYDPIKAGGLGSVPMEIHNNFTDMGIDNPVFIPMYQQKGKAEFVEYGDDKNGKTFVAPYHSIGEQTYTYSDILWGDQTNTDIFATFSMPEKGIDCRGYVAYPIKEIQDGYIISSWINYTHQESWLQYPVMTAMENRMRNSWNNDGAFMTIQNVFTLYPTDEGVEIIK